MHNGMIEFAEEKMAKSVGNVRLLGETLDEFGRDALIMYFLGGHYRQPLAFSTAQLEQAQAAVRRIVNFRWLLERAAEQRGEDERKSDAWARELRDAFFAALRDDFNTPQALAVLFELVSEGNRRLERGEDVPGLRRALAELLDVLGLGNLLAAEAPVDAEAEALAAERERARREGDFERADVLRSELAERGYEVRDTPDGPVLVRSDAA
jgi:cysteinyl-tRNA synthetase